MKVKLKDLTREQLCIFREKQCEYGCSNCPFRYIACTDFTEKKEMYSERLLNQEIIIPQNHIFKIKEEFYCDIRFYNKRFEIRKNDRDYCVGDTIEFIVNDKLEPYKWIITYVLKDVPEYGLDKDYCIFGIKLLKEDE